MVADSMEVDFTEAAGMAAIGRREEEMTDDRSQIANGASDGPSEIAEKYSAQPANSGEVDRRTIL